MPTHHRPLFALLVIGLMLAGCRSLPEARQDPNSTEQVADLVPVRPIAGVTTVETLSVDGITRSYRLHLPSGYDSGTPVPLVITLHGYDLNAEQQERVSALSPLADAENFVVIYPQALGDPPSWKFGTRAEGQADVTFIDQLVKELQSKYSIDSARIYAAGISNGAQMTYRLACDLSGVIAAIGLVSGGYPAVESCEPTRPVPAVVFHGTADRLLPYEGKPPQFQPVREWVAGWAKRNGCTTGPSVIMQQGDVTGEAWGECHGGADVTFYTVEGKGHSWPGSAMPAAITTKDIDASKVIWQFFQDHPAR